MKHQEIGTRRSFPLMATFFLIALFMSGVACAPAESCSSGCTGADGNCMTCSGGYSCNSGGTCSAVVNGVACCTGGGGGSQVCNTGYCYSNGACCPAATPWYDRGGHGYAAGCYASCPYVGDCGTTKICY